MSTPDDFLITIEGQRFEGWEGLEVARALDEISTVSFSTYWDPAIPELRKLFRPHQLQSIEVDTGRNERVFTGLVTAGNPENDEDSTSRPLAGFGLPGLLDRSSESREFHKLELAEIARQLGLPFGLEADFRSQFPGHFAQVAMENESPWAFLVKIAQQKGALLTDSPAGRLLAWQATTSGAPVLELTEGQAPCGAVSVDLGSDWYSEIIGHAGAKRGKGGTKYSAKNPHYRGRYPCPHSFDADDTESADLPRAVNSKLGRMLGNAVSWTTTLPGIRDPNGDLFAPNTLVRLKHPSTYCFRATDLLVRKVVYKVATDELSSTLSLVLPGSFAGNMPQEMPWDD